MAEMDTATALLLSRRRGGGLATAIGFGAAALGVALVGTYAVNQASKARAHGVEEASKAFNAGQTEVLRILATQQGVERTSRETWQNFNTPSMTNYIDVAAGAGSASGAGASSTSDALAAAFIASQGGNNGQVCPSPVALYTPAQPFNGCCNG
ncbi:MAG: hypothetical protein R3Y39_08555 [Rikenellaceae bacterium]